MKRKNEVIEESFRVWVERGEVFIDPLKKGVISYWDFNSCVWSKPGDYIYVVILEQDKDYFIQLKFEEIDRYKGFVLLRK